MKAIALFVLAAVAAFAETKVTWNVIDVEKLRQMGVPGITPATFDGVFVYAEWVKSEPLGEMNCISLSSNPPQVHCAPGRSQGYDIGYSPVTIFARNPDGTVTAEAGVPSAFKVTVQFEEGAEISVLASIAFNAPCKCAAVTVPFPKNAQIRAPKRITVTPFVFVAAAGGSKEAIE